MPLPQPEREQAADLLRKILDAVSTGDLAADGRAAVAVVRRLEGALMALEAIDGDRSRPGS